MKLPDSRFRSLRTAAIPIDWYENAAIRHKFVKP